MSSKLQVAALTGLIVGGAALLQNSLPHLASSAGLRYLRAEYKLVTGDTAGALRLMQPAAQPPLVSASSVPTTDSDTAPACSRTAAPHPIAARRHAAPKAHLLTVSVPIVRAGGLQRLTVKVPNNASVQQARILADIRARTALQNARMEETMRHLEARLRNLPIPPAAPAAPVAFPVEPGSNLSR